MTIRRDLRYLESRKYILQIKGGAVVHPAQYEPESLLNSLNDLKFELADLLYDKIFPCSRIFIGTGTTCLAFAKTVARRNSFPVTVITHSLSVASALFRSRCKVILLGGELRTTSMDLVGEAAERSLTEYKVEWLISGCDGALADYGFYTSDMRLSKLGKETISVAEKVAIITESSKFGSRSLTRFAARDEVDLLVTDGNISACDAEKLKSCGIELCTTCSGSCPVEDSYKVTTDV
jgi:DeoR family transcriptional regulator of aga operon